MEDEIQDKLEEVYNFRIDVKFKDFRQYEIYGQIDNEKVFCIPILYDVRATLEANITEIRNRIVGMLGDVPRIELFARQTVEGWDCWGNEVGGEDE